MTATAAATATATTNDGDWAAPSRLSANAFFSLSVPLV